MNNRTFLVIAIFAFLAVALFVGSPFEFLDKVADTIATLSIEVLFGFLFILLFRQIRLLKNKIVKWLFYGVTVLLIVPYMWIGIWTTLLVVSDYHPMWEDVTMYTNDRNSKIISQWRETSGSIHDFRTRRVLADFGQWRISYNYNAKNLEGIWIEYSVAEKTSRTVNFGDD